VLAVPPALAVAALRNLVDNALRYSPAGSPVEVITWSESESEPEHGSGSGSVRFRVIDRGRGLQPAGHAHATQRFWRGAMATGNGSGLGLAIVDAIATRYGGHVALESGEAGGTIADLSLPRH